MVGAKGIKKISDVEEIQIWSEGGYMCGYKVPGNKFYVQRKLFCGDILSHNITITWVGRKQIVVSTAEY